MTLDKMTRDAISSAVYRASQEANEIYKEKWVSGAELCQQFHVFTPGWLKTYGSSLPRERISVLNPDGSTRKTGWCYPRNKIARMLASGELRNIRPET